MTDPKNEVLFCEYCKTCKHKLCDCEDEPCCDCLAAPVNYYSHKPVLWEGVDTLFNKPVERRDHATERAVREALLLNARDLAEIEEPKNNLASKVHMRDVISCAIDCLKQSCDCTNMTYGDLMTMLQRTITGQLVLDPSVKVIDTAVTKGYTGYNMVMAPEVETIGNGAFVNCGALDDITIPNLTNIEDNAFKNCHSLTNTTFYNLIQKVVNIGKYAFYNCSSLRNLTIPQALSIGEEAFSYCTSLTSVTINNNADILPSAFVDCFNLKTLSIPKVTKLRNIFSGCTSLESVNGPEISSIISSRILSQCKSLKSLSFPKLIDCSSYSFARSDYLESVDFPILEQVPNYAFYDNPKLVNVNIPNMKSIGEQAFRECESLKSISLDKVTKIYAYAFAGCTSLESVDLPSLTEIDGDRHFNGCTSLKSVSIPNCTFNGIGSFMFAGCSSLKDVNIQSLVGEIPESMFNGCSSLKTINLPGATKIGANAFNGCGSLESIALNSVTEVKTRGLAGLRINIDLPNLVTIGAYGFSQSNITELDFPKATVIGERAFSYCTLLKHVAFGDVTSMGANVFYNCYALEYIDLTRLTKRPSIKTTTFTGVPTKCELRVPPEWYDNISSAWGKYFKGTIVAYENAETETT